MTRSLRDRNEPRRILEVGPGTGPFTKVILNNLRPQDEFHIVEINPAFCAQLEQNMLGPYRAANPNTQVSLHEGPIQSARLEPGFHHIVCGLPFNNFPPRLVRSSPRLPRRSRPRSFRRCTPVASQYSQII